MGHLPLFERAPAASVVRANLWGCIFLLSHPMYGSLLMQLKEMKPPCPACLPLSPPSPWFVNLTARYWVPRALSPGQRWINTFGNWNPGSKTQRANALYGPESLFWANNLHCWDDLVQFWPQYITLKLYFSSKNTYENCLINSPHSFVQ